MDLSKYLKIFLTDSQEHLQRMDEFLLRLERHPEDAQAIDALFRSAHSLKGMATTMGFDDLSKIAHSLESFLEPCRRGVQQIDRQGIDLLLQGVDLLRQSIAEVDAEKGTGGSEGQGGKGTRLSKPSRPPAPQGGTVRREGMLRVAPELLDDLVDLTNELLVAQEDLGSEEQAAKFQTLIQAVGHQAMRLRMVPLQTVADRFPRMVRDLARQGNKEVAFQVKGSDVEMDRALLEGVAEPLMHLLRNAVDHGIEGPEERIKSEKPSEGKVRLEAAKEKDGVIIRVRDDGRGIDPDAVRQTAVARGLLSEAKARTLSETDVFRLLTLPGFSTKAEVSEISGRGVGLDAVQSTIQSLQGSLLLESVPGEGTTVTLKLPLTLIRLPVLLVQVGDETYAIPVTQVRATLDCPPEKVRPMGGREVLIRNEAQVPVVQLRGLVGFPILVTASLVVVVESRGKEVGVLVDKILEYREVVVKSFRSPLRGLKGLGGMTILGDGLVVPILDFETLLP
ncbi:MAG: chemotaxis protein CheA [Candidatus Methylomirabilales bacterium]